VRRMEAKAASFVVDGTIVIIFADGLNPDAEGKGVADFQGNVDPGSGRVVAGSESGWEFRYPVKMVDVVDFAPAVVVLSKFFGFASCSSTDRRIAGRGVLKAPSRQSL